MLHMYLLLLTRVQTSKKNMRSGVLSQQVGRVGYHFPSTVVEQACQLLGITLTRLGHIRDDQRRNTNAYNNRSIQSKKDGRKQDAKARESSVGKDMSQEDIDARAASAIRDLFPKIPDKDVKRIIARAFQKAK